MWAGACSGEAVVRTRCPGLGWRLEVECYAFWELPQRPQALWSEMQESGWVARVLVSQSRVSLVRWHLGSHGGPGTVCGANLLGRDGRKGVLNQDSRKEIHPGVMEREGGDGD